jgi:hypothetical protein
MIYCKEECKQLVSAKAAVLVLDTHMENGAPVFVTRRVTGMGGCKYGRDSKWFVALDKNFDDGCAGAYPGNILGVNTGEMLDISPLVDFVHKRYSFLPMQERLMLISDARVRLKEAKK